MGGGEVRGGGGVDGGGGALGAGAAQLARGAGGPRPQRAGRLARLPEGLRVRT